MFDAEDLGTFFEERKRSGTDDRIRSRRRTSSEKNGNSLQYEIGLTLGSSQSRRIWGIPLPRVGIGYRFGSNLDVFRIVFGTPF